MRKDLGRRRQPALRNLDSAPCQIETFQLNFESKMQQHADYCRQPFGRRFALFRQVTEVAEGRRDFGRVRRLYSPWIVRFENPSGRGARQKKSLHRVKGSGEG